MSNEIDSWEAAFAALEEKTGEAGEADLSGTASGDSGSVGNSDDVALVSADSNGDAVSGDGASQSNGRSIDEMISDYVSEISLDATRKTFEKRGYIVDENGPVKVTMDNGAVYKADEDGIMRFFNPETGNPFTGENPRAQAREWVNGFNQDNAEMWESYKARSNNELSKMVEPIRKMAAFAPTYESLSPQQKTMFESYVEPHAIRLPNGTLVGYNCDLNAALAKSNAQLEKLLGASVATTPALDMKASGSTAAPKKGAPKSLEEAFLMLAEQ